MTSLVSDFLIEPVLRQARRFSSPFAANREPDPEPRVRSRFVLGEPDDAVIDWDEDEATLQSTSFDSRRSPRWGAWLGGSPERRPRRVGDGVRLPTTQEGDVGMSDDEVEPVRLIPALGTPVIEGPEVPAQDLVTKVDYTADGDGHGALRRRILSIHSKNISMQQKARMVQDLFSESMEKHSDAPKPSIEPVESYARPLTPSSPTTIWEQPIGVGLDGLRSWLAAKKAEAIKVTAADAEPTYVPDHLLTQTSSVNGADNEKGSADTDENDGGGIRVLGCEHYRRNVKLQCAACDKWYTCRLCHDEAENHVLPRRETKHMLCMLCGTAQAASDTCVECGLIAAQYYCNICKLWNDDGDKQIYHCDDCGICRVGRGLGKDFFHCKTCRACIAVSIEKTHKCIERVTHSNCPICSDFMFSSPQTVVFMNCGHCIHRTCYQEHLKTSYKCPICSKSIVNMEASFRNLDRSIREQPMPEEYHNTKALILCNDCSTKTTTDYHFLGLKCQVCYSYNTTEVNRTGLPDEIEPVTTIDASQRPSMPSRQISPQSPMDIHMSNTSWHDLTRIASVPIPHSPEPSAFVWGNEGQAPEASPADLDMEEEVNFWGDDGPRSGGSSAYASSENEEMDGEEDDDDDESDVEGELDNAEEAEDDFDLPGHR